ncbi:GTP pyrophosphokinase [Bacillus kwashiorkori]|uniref:GTP pyrophosphokinase n=1 Tax=Bacillus kwashiorkori TaxID=1522318 RepID=UPI000785211B|nr:GTP pyrophosphokinase family protein [Bacillus kwashiorkori]
MDNWEEFLGPYRQAVEELKVKLKGLRRQFETEGTRSAIEFVTGRVKPIKSILDKAEQKNIALSNLEQEMQDIAGLRIVCQFVEDIYNVVKLLKMRNDFEVIEERDYIKEKKKSGYRSYHLLIEYPVQTIHGEKRILAEIQIRTLAMNFWATIEHSLNYKYNGEFPEDIQKRLLRAAEAAFLLDNEMSLISEEIREAQAFFTSKRES